MIQKSKAHEISHLQEAALCNKIVQAVDLMIVFNNILGKLEQMKNLSHIQDNAITFPEKKDVVGQGTSEVRALHVSQMKMPTKCFTSLE